MRSAPSRLAVVVATLLAAACTEQRPREETLQSGEVAAAASVAPQAASPPPPAPPVASDETALARDAAVTVVPLAAVGGRAGIPAEGAREEQAPGTGFPSGAAVPIPAPGDPAPLVIRTGSATLEVDALDRGMGRVRQLVQSVPGAYVANMSVDGGRDQPRRATLEVKVPAADFDRLVAGLTPLGKVETVNVAAQDVTEEFVDLTARAENARRLEARLVDLLARRTGKLEEVLRVERELARVREEIERYDGRLRFLRSRAALSTLSIMVHEPVPMLGDRPTVHPIAEAVREGWRSFVGLVAGAIALSGVLVPLALLGYVGWVLVRRFRPTRPARRPAVAAE